MDMHLRTVEGDHLTMVEPEVHRNRSHRKGSRKGKKQLDSIDGLTFCDDEDFVVVDCKRVSLPESPELDSYVGLYSKQMSDSSDLDHGTREQVLNHTELDHRRDSPREQELNLTELDHGRDGSREIREQVLNQDHGRDSPREQVLNHTELDHGRDSPREQILNHTEWEEKAIHLEHTSDLKYEGDNQISSSSQDNKGEELHSKDRLEREHEEIHSQQVSGEFAFTL